MSVFVRKEDQLVNKKTGRIDGDRQAGTWFGRAAPRTFNGARCSMAPDARWRLSRLEQTILEIHLVLELVILTENEQA